VIISEKENYFNGNTVLVPEYIPTNPKKREELEKLEKARKQNVEKKRNKRIEYKFNVIRNIGIIFIIGITLIYRYSVIYNMQKNINMINDEISTVNKQNEDLRIQLIKVSSIQEVEKVATEKLHMISPDKNHVIYSDLSKNNFIGEATKNTNIVEKENIFNKLISMLF
jgi:cell division protein FtsL